MAEEKKIKSRANSNSIKDLTQSSKNLPAITDDPDFKALQAVIHARKNALFQNAKEQLQTLLNKRPEWIPARRELVMLYIATESFNEAEEFLTKECKRLPEDDWLWLMLANVHHRRGNIKSEIDALQKTIELKYDTALVHRLFELQRSSGDLNAALDTVIGLRKLNDSITLEIAEAKLLFMLKRSDEAIKMSDELLEKAPDSKEAIELWLANHLARDNNPEIILKKFEPWIESGTKVAAVYAAVGHALHRMENHGKALKTLTKALELDPSQSQWWYDLSLVQRQMGMLTDAQASMEKSIDLNPMSASGLRVFATEHKFTLTDPILKKYNFAHASISQFSDEKKVELYYGLGKVYEDLDDLATAFKHYENGGKLQTKLTPYRHASALSTLKMTRDKVGPLTYEKFNLPRNESSKPLFVLGMPRSGTSLTEQVVSSHPEVHGAGELKLLHRVVDGISINKRAIETKSSHGVIPTFIPGIDLSNTRQLKFNERGDLYVKAIELLAKLGGKPDAKRIIDKMPGNYFWTGVIPYILPNAKIIHTQRHPLDNCLSLYRIFFPDGMPWSYDLRNLGKVYRAYFEHMQYWEKNLPKGMMLTVNYEVMIVHFEDQAKKIIQHIDLDWNENCLRFYENERNVKTASLSQVRKPIYTSSVGRWKKYEDYLKPLILELGPLVKHYDEMIDNKLKELSK